MSGAEMLLAMTSVKRSEIISARKADALVEALKPLGVEIAWKQRKDGKKSNTGFLTIGKPAVLRETKDRGGNPAAFCVKGAGVVRRTKEGVALTDYGVSPYRVRHIVEEDEDRYSGGMILNPEELSVLLGAEAVKHLPKAVQDVMAQLAEKVPQVQKALAEYNAKLQ